VTPLDVSVQTDASRSQAGEVIAGWVIVPGGLRPAVGYRRLHRAEPFASIVAESSTAAEFWAVLAALDDCRRRRAGWPGDPCLSVGVDDQGAATVLAGGSRAVRIRRTPMVELVEAIWALAAGFPSCVFAWVPREANRQAHRLTQKPHRASGLVETRRAYPRSVHQQIPAPLRANLLALPLARLLP
jgi:ribonuclease HI